MEVSAIVNSPAQHQKQVKRNNVLRSALGGAGIGAAINGFQAFSQQKAILKNGDAYIKEIAERMEQVSEPAIKEELKKFAEAAEKFIKGGKVNYKAVGRTALKGAAMFGLVFAGVELISNAMRNRKAKKEASQPKQV